jgi:hypothetical protein
MQQAWVFLSNELIYLSKSLFRFLYLLPESLVLEFDDFLQLLVVFLVEFQVKDLDVLKFGGVVEG